MLKKEESKSVMTNNEKAVAMIGMLSLCAEYAEDLMEDGSYGRLFTQSTKKAANDMIKHSDKIVNRLCLSDGENGGVNEEIQAANEAITVAVEGVFED